VGKAKPRLVSVESGICRHAWGNFR
jgi:hypothetical protein